MEERKGSPWTTSEINALYLFYPKYGAHVDRWPIKIDRTKGAVSRQAHRYGIYVKGIRSKMDAENRDKLRDAFLLICRKLNVSPNDAVKELNRMRYRSSLIPKATKET